MTTQAPTEVTVTATTETKSPADASTFAEYEAIRRGASVAKESAPAAPEAKAPEQKESETSATPETEAKEETKDESDELDADEAESKEDAEKDEKPKKKGGFQRRIDKLNARFAEERAAREALERRLAELSAGKPSEATKQAAPSETKPKADQFDTHEAYVEALTDWKIGEREKASRAEQQKSALESERKTALKSHTERLKAFTEKTEDFHDVLENLDDVPVSSTVESVILRSDVGPEMLYELAKNKAEALRISALPAIDAARELGKIEARLTKASEAKTTETKKITQAPKPLTPVGKTAAPVAKNIYDPATSFADYERIRREQLRKKRA